MFFGFEGALILEGSVAIVLFNGAT